jgi:molybdopterin/thiamine biosynthesis adenylyltransferase
MQTAFPWTKHPSIGALNEIAEQVSVILWVDPVLAVSDQAELITLAVSNIVGRLPVSLAIRTRDKTRRRPMPPYRGETLHGAVADLAKRLARQIDISTPGRTDGLCVEINTPGENLRWRVATDGWRAYMGGGRVQFSDEYNPVSAYFVGCMIGGEVLRAWARETARTSVDHLGPSFRSRVRPASDRWVNLWEPGTGIPGPPAHASGLPSTDWVGTGAVNQATLAVIAATPGWTPAGSVTDPKALDLPDLNRSLLSFCDDVDKPKALITADTVGQGHLASVQGRYPGTVRPNKARWIVAGTDDVEVRSEIQRLWPHRLVVTATEGVFGYIAWHAPERADLPCAACEPTDGLQHEDRIPTSAPTSTTAGVVAASTLLHLARRHNVPGRTDILTLRLDSEYALDASHPSPTPGCNTCRTRLSRDSRRGLHQQTR